MFGEIWFVILTGIKIEQNVDFLKSVPLKKQTRQNKVNVEAALSCDVRTN
jgi:hypothetical protein